MERHFGQRIVLTAVATEVSIERQVRRWVTRTERLWRRMVDAAQGLFLVLAWFVGSTLLFAAFTGVATSLDRRLLRQVGDRWAHGLRMCWHGARLFWKAAAHRGLPLAPRVLLGAAVLYWLSPIDLLGESWGWLSGLDDGVVAAGAGRLFLRLCPAEVLQRYAEEEIVA